MAQAEIVLSQDGPTLELAIAVWLDAKAKKSGSWKTATAYKNALENFRQALWSSRLELDSDPRKVAIVAQAWASQRVGGRGGTATDVAPATFNQRLAIVSSFYAFGLRRGLLAIRENPIAQVERRTVQSYAAALPLDAQTARERLARIDRGTLLGLRDYALLTPRLRLALVSSPAPLVPSEIVT